VQGLIQVVQYRPNPLREVCGQGGVGSSRVATAAVVDLLALVATYVPCLLPRRAAPRVRAGAAPLGWPAGGIQVPRAGRRLEQHDGRVGHGPVRR
jgi:hypothetical protein